MILAIGVLDREKQSVLLCIDWFEFDTFVSVHPTTGWAALIKVLFDMVPAKSTYLAAYVHTRVLRWTKEHRT